MALQELPAHARHRLVITRIHVCIIMKEEWISAPLSLIFSYSHAFSCRYKKKTVTLQRKVLVNK